MSVFAFRKAPALYGYNKSRLNIGQTAFAVIYIDYITLASRVP